MKFSHRQLFALALIGAALLLGACGGGDGSSPTDADRRAPAFIPDSKEERRAYSTASGLYRTLAAAGRRDRSGAGGAASICKLMSPQLQAQMVAASQASSGPQGRSDCASAVAFLLGRSTQRAPLSATQSARVIDIEVSGDTATATIETATGETSKLPLLRQGNAWVLAASG